ncbi:hypothetical protein MBLNU459_g7659t1 [Dothideomycetes sp. NU459]
MTLTNDQASSSEAPRRTFKVLANKNAPYGNATSNPAGTVAGSLPASIPMDSALNSTGTQIEIVDAVAGGFAAIPGTYADTRDSIAKIHETYSGKVDLFVHLGRSPWSWITVERRAFSQEMSSSWLREENYKGYYVGRDHNGQRVQDLGPCPWKAKGVPIGLDTELDVDAVVSDANAALDRHDSGGEHLTVKSHLEAGGDDDAMYFSATFHVEKRISIS